MANYKNLIINDGNSILKIFLNRNDKISIEIQCINNETFENVELDLDDTIELINELKLMKQDLIHFKEIENCNNIKLN